MPPPEQQKAGPNDQYIGGFRVEPPIKAPPPEAAAKLQAIWKLASTPFKAPPLKAAPAKATWMTFGPAWLDGYNDSDSEPEYEGIDDAPEIGRAHV